MSTSTVLLANLILLALLSPSIILLLYLMAKTAKEAKLNKEELKLYKKAVKDFYKQ